MTDATATPSSETPSIAAVASEPLAGDTPAAARTLGESLYPVEAQPAAEPKPAVVDTSTDQLTPPVEGEAKPPVEAEATPTEEKPAEVAPLTPESYADLKVAEGFEVNDAALTDAKTIFTEGQVPPVVAQKLLDLYTSNIKAASEAAQAASQEAFTSLNTKWSTETNALPEMQGEAKKQTLAILGRTMDEFGSPEAREAFNLTGAGNNPHIVKYILSLAQAVVEGSPTPGGRPAHTDPRKGKSLGQRLYPSSN